MFQSARLNMVSAVLRKQQEALRQRNEARAADLAARREGGEKVAADGGCGDAKLAAVCSYGKPRCSLQNCGL